MRALTTAIIAIFMFVATTGVGFAQKTNRLDALNVRLTEIKNLVEKAAEEVCPKDGIEKITCRLEFISMKQKVMSVSNYLAMAGVAALTKNYKRVDELVEKALKVNAEIPGEFAKVYSKWESRATK